MKTDKLILAFAYLRLSREEAQNRTESESITNQRMIIEDYCKKNGIYLVREFADDGWSGGNFERPAFQDMLVQLDKGIANTVITKDLSRLGRDMAEASRYSEKYFPEHGIRYLTVLDSFDSNEDNVWAPFQFAMNEVYLRDGSKKIKEVLKYKRSNGQYCACPPYGYKKDSGDKSRLVPDEVTAPIVRRIFEAATNGDSTRKIAKDLNLDGVIPPLKYRVLYRDEFSEEGAAHASDTWNYTTVKRILKNRVYLGHTILGKSKKVSVKSKKKVALSEEDWCVTYNTHEPLVSEITFEYAQRNLAYGSSQYNKTDNVRKSIFSGIVYCKKCGHALCSGGTVYKGEREKYWYLTCTYNRKDIEKPCSGTRIRYTDLVELVRKDLNSLLALSPDEEEQLVKNVMKKNHEGSEKNNPELQRKKHFVRLDTIGKIISKLYTDNAEGKLSDDRLYSMVTQHEKEAESITKELKKLENSEINNVSGNFERFWDLARRYTHIDEINRDILLTFVDRIEIGEKVSPFGTKSCSRYNQPYSQEVKIYYKFIGNIRKNDERSIG